MRFQMLDTVSKSFDKYKPARADLDLRGVLSLAKKVTATGAENVIDAALNNDVEKVIALSTDKAANPINRAR